MKVGVWFYGLGTALTGILDIAWGALEASHQPIQSLGKNLPSQHTLAYLAGVWLVAAGLVILWRRGATIGAAKQRENEGKNLPNRSVQARMEDFFYHELIKYLKLALEKGFKESATLATDADIANLRKLVEFNQLMKQYFPGMVM